MEKVIIYTPTYRNEHIFSLVLDSYLGQTYKNIEVRVFDNSLADGFNCIQSICEKNNDSRLSYFANNSQLGAHASYYRILSSIDFNSMALVLASDMALAPDAIKEMISIRLASRSSIVMPATRNYLSSWLKEYPNREFFARPFTSLKSLTDSVSTLNKYEVLEKYFSPDNLTGEFFKFSFFGCLFDGALVAGIGRNYTRFKFHGAEQYLSMGLIIRSNNVSFTPSELLWNFYGHDRLGGTQRLNSDIGRAECILACQMILEENDLFLLADGVDIAKLRFKQMEKALYFKNNFKGFGDYIDYVIQRNMT